MSDNEESQLTFNQHNVEEMHGNNFTHYVRLSMKNVPDLPENIQGKYVDTVHKTAHLAMKLQNKAIDESNEKYDEQKMMRDLEVQKEILRQEIIDGQNKEESKIDNSSMSPKEKQKAKLEGARERMKNIMGKKDD